MNIVNITEDVFNKIILDFLDFKKEVLLLCDRTQSKQLDYWLDNQDVCLMLNISPRTLQNYRDMGRLSFSRISHKMYYRASDVEKLLTTKMDKT